MFLLESGVESDQALGAEMVPALRTFWAPQGSVKKLADVAVDHRVWFNGGGQPEKKILNLKTDV